MRINSSFIGMDSARRYASSTTKAGRYLVKDYGKNAVNNLRNSSSGLMNADTEQKEAGQAGDSSKSRQSGKEDRQIGITMRDVQERYLSVRNSRVRLADRDNTISEIRQKSISYIFTLLFGENKMKDLLGDTGGSSGSRQDAQEQISASLNAGQISGQKVLVFSNQVSYREWEKTSFSAQGIVRTADGREISFNMDVAMSRSFAAYYEANFEMVPVNTCDPLVINLEGNAAGLTDQKFLFDIDGNGTQDEVSMLNQGSGYLALDKNNDGMINDGKELFGPQSGNGFSDLAAFDGDGNGWIDENDEIWSKLKIWCKNPDGTDSLYTLSEKGVGAICLGNASTDFELKGAEGKVNGYIRSTGIFLYESGSVGTVQHVDVAQ